MVPALVLMEGMITVVLQAIKIMIILIVERLLVVLQLIHKVLIVIPFMLVMKQHLILEELGT